MNRLLANYIARSFASSPSRAPPRDSICITGMQFFARHGVLQAEKDLGQRFEVDVEMRVDVKEAGRADDLTKTVDYTKVYNVVRGVVEGQRYDLIEAAAETVASDILRGFAAVGAVRVEVRKPHVALGGILSHVSVTVRRMRGDVEGEGGAP